MILDHRLGMLGAVMALLWLCLGASLTHAAIDPGMAGYAGSSTLVEDASPAPAPLDPSSHRHEEAGKRRLRQMEPAACTADPCSATHGNLPRPAVAQIRASDSDLALHPSGNGTTSAWLPHAARLRLTLHPGQAP